jgi:hypothetical protein
VLDRIGRAMFPADLAPLATLPDDEARQLVSALVRKVLLVPVTGQAVALAQLDRVVTAVNGTGRDIRAGLPDELLTLPPERWRHGGRLLPFVDTAEIEAAVAGTGSAEVAATLTRAMPHLRRDPAAAGADVLTHLLGQLRAVMADDERPTRGEPTPVPPPAGQRRIVHPLLDAPDRVDAGVVFELRAGLAERPSPGVEQPLGEGMRVPAGAFTLAVELLLDGFVILGSPPTLELVADEGDPYPYVVVRLRALDDPAYAARRKIVAAYRLGDQLLGLAFRWVQVGAEAPPEPPPAQRDREWILDADERRRPDLYVQVISGNNQADPRLMWLFGSPHPHVPGSGGWIAHGRPEKAEEWSRVRFRGVQDRRGQDDDLTDYLRGFGKEIRALIPPRLWTALRTAGTAATVLLGTTDAYLPWELALLPEDWDEPYGETLGGYAAVGRWVHPGEATGPGPAADIEVRRMAVVSGVYQGRQRLEDAEREATDLAAAFAASPVDARYADVRACLGADPPYDIVHFAVHGSFDATGAADGILMVDGKYLSPTSVRGLPRTGIRLVFLNACQLGREQSLLGEPNGMVPSLVDIGADAVIAPLWKVDDEQAREVAAGLYATLRDGGSPAEYFRQQRRASRGREGQPFGTRLAYLYFGHPRLSVTWP